MSDIERFVTIWGGGGMMPANNGIYVRYGDHQAEVERLKNAIEHLTSERDEAQAEVKLLRANVQRMFDSSRPTDEDIWREAFMRCVSEYVTGEKRVIIADTMLAEYRKRWPR